MHMPSTKQKIAIGYFILAFLGLVLMQTVFFTPQSENLSYRDFKTLLKAGKVIDLLLWERTITGRLSTDGLEGLLPLAKIEELRTSGRGELRFVTVQVDDPTLIPDLEAAGVQFQGRIESRWLGTLLSWIVPALVFVAIWGLFMRRMGTASGLMTIGKSKAKVYVEQATGVTFDDVAGMDEARAELMEIVDFLKRPEHYRRLGGRDPQGGAARRRPRDRQNPPRQGGGGRSRGALLQLERGRLRRDVRGRWRGPRARPLRAGAGDGPEHHLHRRVGCPGEGARRQSHDGRPR